MSDEPKNEKTGQIEPAPPRAPGRLWRVAKPALGVAILAGLIISSMGIFRARTGPGHVEALNGVAVPPDAARITVQSGNIAPQIGIAGTVSSEITVNLSARLGAVVQTVSVSAGSPVKKDQELLMLDDRDLQEQAASAAAQFKQAESEYKRAQGLFGAQAATAQALAAAEATLASARAQWERSKVMLTYACIVAPMDGIVTDRRVEVGNLASPGQVLLSLYAPSSMQLEVPVPVRLVGKLPVGQTVEVLLDRPARIFNGKVRQIVSELDPLSRTQLVKVHLEAAPGELLPGTFGRLLVNEEARPAMTLPATAVYAVGQIEFAQVVQGERAIRRAIKTGPRHKDSVEVLSGLSSGEIVLLSPVQED
ncbi:MAG: efflux RND transporter periplasmic adaptor subunit [bacterium]